MIELRKGMLLFWLVIIIMEAPLRYYSSALGFPGIVYLKDFVLLLIFLYFLVLIFKRKRIDALILIILAGVAYGCLVGMLNGLSISQVAFGAKMFLPFVVAFIAVYYLQVERDFLGTMFRWLVPVVLLGILLELFGELPWKGEQYSAFGVDIDASREWTTLGLPRLSGFGRASYETAAIILSLVALNLTATLVSSGEPKRATVRYYDYLLSTLSIAGIVVTTSKTAMLATVGLLISAVLIKFALERRAKGDRASLGLKLFILFFALFGMIPPAIAAINPSYFSQVLDSDNLFWKAVTFSFVERMESTWPEALHLLDGGWRFLSGRGIGGIGASQFYFEPENYNPADNFYIYVLISFGIVFTAVVIAYLIKNLVLCKPSEQAGVPFFIFCLIIFVFGATMNIVESSILMFTLGILAGLWKHGKANLH
ncbi:MAG: hypothetical protein AB1690_13165 [Candidatus Zixiibacteriota bacterium]